MNGKEQAARHSRLNDLDTVVEGLAAEMVKDRETADARMQDVAALIAPLERLLKAHELELRCIETQLATIETRLKPGTLWQRLRWIVRGA